MGTIVTGNLLKEKAKRILCTEDESSVRNVTVMGCPHIQLQTWNPDFSSRIWQLLGMVRHLQRYLKIIVINYQITSSKFIFSLGLSFIKFLK